jgi:hypothetical protein
LVATKINKQMKTAVRKKSREKIMSILQDKYPSLHVSTTEDFGISKGGVWLCGECGDVDRNGDELFNYYAENYNKYTFGVINHLNNWAQRNGWWFEWYDAGTIMMWEL